MAVILGLLGFRTLRELSSLQAQETRLSRTIRTTFVESFPEEKKIVNELAQMTTHLDSLRRQRDALVAATGVTVRPLWALQVLSQTLASDAGIRISSFVVAGDTIRVAGTGDSFESIEQFQGKLRKVSQFDSVELEDMASSRGNERPGFRLLISVKAG
jgi:type II secretory pathway component PulL